MIKRLKAIIDVLTPRDRVEFTTVAMMFGTTIFTVTIFIWMIGALFGAW